MSLFTKKNLKLLMFGCLAASFAFALHQYITWGYWFETKDFLHHETVIFGGLLAAIIIYITIFYRRQKQ